MRPVAQWTGGALARVGGVLYLVVIVLGLLGEAAIRARLVVGGDVQATAQNILAAEGLWRLGVAGQMLLLVCALGLTFCWYRMFAPVNRPLAQLLLLFAIVSLAIESVGALHLQAVLAPLRLAISGAAADPHALHTLAYLSLSAHNSAFGLALIFFGIECVIVGLLIRQSGYYPAALGWLLQLAGLCYLVNSAALVLSPALHGMLFPAILLPVLVAESAVCLFMMFKPIALPTQQFEE